MAYPYKIEQNFFSEYLSDIENALDMFEKCLTPILGRYLTEFDIYKQKLQEKTLHINYDNPMLYTQRGEFYLYMLQVEYANRFWKTLFNSIPLQKKILLLPRCLSGSNFDNFKVKRTKYGWHQIIHCNDKSNPAWRLTELGEAYNFQVFITMGQRFKEPSFMKIFKTLKKKFGSFGLIAVACLPELALGRTFIMEMGIPTQAIPLLYSGCAKWHGDKKALTTAFDMNSVLKLLGLPLDKEAGGDI